MKDGDLGNNLMDLSPLKLGVASESGAYFWAVFSSINPQSNPWPSIYVPES